MTRVRREASQILAGPADIPSAPAIREQNIRDALWLPRSALRPGAPPRPVMVCAIGRLPFCDTGLHAVEAGGCGVQAELALRNVVLL
jgi:hypothetical protein